MKTFTQKLAETRNVMAIEELYALMSSIGVRPEKFNEWLLERSLSGMGDLHVEAAEWIDGRHRHARRADRGPQGRCDRRTCRRSQEPLESIWRWPAAATAGSPALWRVNRGRNKRPQGQTRRVSRAFGSHERPQAQERRRRHDFPSQEQADADRNAGQAIPISSPRSSKSKVTH